MDRFRSQINNIPSQYAKIDIIDSIVQKANAIATHTTGYEEVLLGFQRNNHGLVYPSVISGASHDQMEMYMTRLINWLGETRFLLMLHEAMSPYRMM